MLICNLDKILKERNFSVSRLYEQTGISRDTITKLTTNAGSGVHFDTIEKICKHLGITMDELFAHIPTTLEFKKDWLPDQLPDNTEFDFETYVTICHDSEKHSPTRINLRAIIIKEELDEKAKDMEPEWDFQVLFDTPIDEMKFNTLFYYFYESDHKEHIEKRITQTLLIDIDKKLGGFIAHSNFIYLDTLLDPQKKTTPKDITGNAILYLLEQQKTTQSEE